MWFRSVCTGSADRGLELSEPGAEGSAQLGNALGAEKQHDDAEQHQDVDWILKSGEHASWIGVVSVFLDLSFAGTSLGGKALARSIGR